MAAPPDLSTILKELLAWVWSRFQLPIVQTIFGAFLGLSVPPMVKWVRRRFRIGNFYSLMDTILKSEAVVPLVVPHIRTAAFHVLRSPSNAISPPENVSFIGLQEALGVATFRQTLSGAYPQKRFPLATPPNFALQDCTCICIGGPFANELTSHLLYHCNLISDFELKAPDPVARDLRTGQTYAAVKIPASASSQAGETLLSDFGFIVVASNPYNPEKSICLAFGLWPQGSQAALRYLLAPRSESQLEKKFLRMVSLRQGVLAIVETKVHELTQGEPRLVNVREL